MESELLDIAGAYNNRQNDKVRMACYAELNLTILQLQKQGVPRGTIIAALAYAVMCMSELNNYN